MALTDIDRNLLKRCLSEEPGAWKDFVDRYLGVFMHVIQHAAHARSVKVSADDIDDLCAEVFLVLLADDYAILRRFAGRSSLPTYLTVVARRVVVKELSRRRMAEAFGHVSAHQSALDQAQASPMPDHQRVDNREEVEQMLAELNPVDAEIVRLYHLESKSYREISSELGISENSIGPTLFRAKEKLRQRNVSS